jgi:beta-xylosidase
MGYAAATSASPEGPFKLVTPSTNLTRNNATSHAGDGHIFVDDDGSAYFIYSAQYYMSIEQLTPDYLASTGKSSPLFSEYFVEAPFMFKRNGTYYALFGHCCCFCYQGSGVIVHTASHPLGPYTAQASGDVACVPSSTDQLQALASSSTTTTTATHGGGDSSVKDIPTPGQGCLYNNANDVSVTRAQQNWLLEVKGGMLWAGDRWSQAPDGLKGHDPTFMAPLTFSADGSIAEMHWVDSFIIEV